jgi:hypothetical protein
MWMIILIVPINTFAQDSSSLSFVNETGRKSDLVSASSAPNQNEQTSRREAERWMLMMQGMAGIGSEDSKWVASKLFEGMLPSPMPCCGEPGSKNADDEHACCERQEEAETLESAFLHFDSQFPSGSQGDRFRERGIAPSSDYRMPGVDELLNGNMPASNPAQLSNHASKTVPNAPRLSFYATEDKIDVETFDQQFNVSAISNNLVYNRFGGYDPDGMMYVLEEDREKMIAGSVFFNGGHDPMFFGTGRGKNDPLHLRHPVTGDWLEFDFEKRTYDTVDQEDDATPVLTTEPLVIRANVGQKVLIRFANRLDGGRASFHLHGAPVAFSEAKLSAMAPEPLQADDFQAQSYYVLDIPDDDTAEGTYYFHSKPAMAMLIETLREVYGFSKSETEKFIDAYFVRGLSIVECLGVVGELGRTQVAAVTDAMGDEEIGLGKALRKHGGLSEGKAKEVTASERAGISATKNQIDSGLFGALIVEPRGSEYLDSESFKPEDDGWDVATFGEAGAYEPVRSGWSSIIRYPENADAPEDEWVWRSFREHVIFFHDELDKVGLKGFIETEPRALNYRTEPFRELWNKASHSGDVLFEMTEQQFPSPPAPGANPKSLPGDLKSLLEDNLDVEFSTLTTLARLGDHWIIDDDYRQSYVIKKVLKENGVDIDKYQVYVGSRPRTLGTMVFPAADPSMAYSAYTFGDSSTPHPRFYVGDPMRYRIIHGGTGDQFHVFHHHAHRWRAQPGVTEAGAEGNTANLTRPSKFGKILSDPNRFPEQPDLDKSNSTRVDSQTLGPAETFDVFMEGGAGGVQRTVGDVLLHCHIINHVTQGMWTYARVFNTLQLPDGRQPGLAPLPDRLQDGIRPLPPVDSETLADRVTNGDPITIQNGALAGHLIQTSDDVNNKLFPYIESQLPPQRSDLVWDRIPGIGLMNRANGWAWSKANNAYFGASYKFDGAKEERPDVVIVGDGTTWRTLRSKHANGVEISPGDYVEWWIGKGLHGVQFLDPNSSPSSYLTDPKSNPPFNGGAAQAPASSSGHLLLRGRVREDLDPALVAEISFQCVIHGSDMNGSLRIVPKKSAEIADFADGFPTKGEGVGAKGAPADSAPRLYLNPMDGRLSYPHLLPTAGARPPFAPKWSLLPPNGGLGRWRLAEVATEQGAAYLGATLPSADGGNVIPGRTSDGKAIGTEFGAGLVPEEVNVRHYDLVALQLAINPTTRKGNWSFKKNDALEGGGRRDYDFGRKHDLEVPNTIVIKATKGFTWKVDGGGSTAYLGVDKTNRAEEIEWWIDDDTASHGLDISAVDIDPDGAGTRFLDFVFQDADTRVVQPKDESGSVPVPSGMKVAPGLKLLAKAKINWNLAPTNDISFKCFVHSAMTGKLVFSTPPTRYDEAVDEKGQIFILRDDLDGILKGDKPAEPVVIRANSGEAIDITLTSALVDQSENLGYSKVGIHTHLVQYDVQSSDGAVAGLNYETSIRPSLNVVEDDNGNFIFERKDGEEESVHYRWWCDTELGFVYFHDHSLLKKSLPHGLFGASIVEPVDSEFRDPVTGDRIYKLAHNGRYTSTKSVNGMLTADIVAQDGSDGFRELPLMFGDGDSGSINLRRVGLMRDRLGLDPRSVAKDDRVNPALAYSSKVHGDPVTPFLRAYPGDRIRIRTEGGGTNQIHSLMLHGHRWRYEWNNPNSTLRDYGLVGVSEAFTFETVAGMPGDYLWGSPEVDEIADEGKWGIVRVLDPDVAPESDRSSGTVRFVLGKNKPTIEKGTRLADYTGTEYETTQDITVPNSPTPAAVLDVPVTAVRPGFEANVPDAIPFSIEPDDLQKLDFREAFSLGKFDGGDKPLTRLPNVTLPEGSGTAAEIQHRFTVAALAVRKSEQSGEFLAYVRLHTEEELALAQAIEQLSVSLDAHPSLEEWTELFDRIKPLRSLLRERFLRAPEPLVLRVPAGVDDALVRVSITLVNLLPAPAELTQIAGEEIRGIGYSSDTSLHVRLAGYDVATADGAVVGRNQPTTVGGGRVRDYVWTVTDELGVCLLSDAAIPSHQSLGLFGALIVEPAGSTFQASRTDRQTECEKIIVRPDNTKYREIVVFQHEGEVSKTVGAGGKLFGNLPKSAVNYFATDESSVVPERLAFAAVAGEEVVIRQVFAAGLGLTSNHTFGADGARWFFDDQLATSNRISVVSEGVGSAYNIRFQTSGVTETHRVSLGSTVGKDLELGAFGEFVLYGDRHVPTWLVRTQ